MLIGRAQQRCGARVTELRRVHAGLLDLARQLEPPAPEDVGAGTRPGAVVRQRVQTHLEQLDADVACGRVSDWLREPVLHVGVVLRRLGEGLYHCYDVPGLPRTDNALEQFYRRVKPSSVGSLAASVPMRSWCGWVALRCTPPHPAAQPRTSYGSS